MRELEFLPEDYIRARFQRRLGFLRSWLLVAVGLAMVLWSLQMGEWVRDAKAELLALRTAGSAAEADVAKVRMLRAEAQTYQRRQNMLQMLQKRSTFTEVVGAVADLLPEGVVLDAITMNYPDGGPDKSATVRLQGSATKDTAVTLMVAAIESSPVFERAVLVESKPFARDEAEGRSFVVEAGVRPPAQAKGN